MDFPAQLFPHSMLWSANAALIVVLITAARRARLGRLCNNEFTHVYFAACVVLLLLWNTRAADLFFGSVHQRYDNDSHGRISARLGRQFR